MQDKSACGGPKKLDNVTGSTSSWFSSSLICTGKCRKHCYRKKTRLTKKQKPLRFRGNRRSF